MRQTLETKPKGGTHWSLRQIAGKTRLLKSTVHRIWRAFGLQPHRQRHFKLSTDPFFVEKVRDIVGLYLHHPENAVVLCVDEKSQIQALERTQPCCPSGWGYVEGVTHDYRRHGTTILFAALDRAKGMVLTRCRQRHRHQQYVDFLRQIDNNVPSDLDVATRPRFHVHVTKNLSASVNYRSFKVAFNGLHGRITRTSRILVTKDSPRLIVIFRLVAVSFD